MINQLQSGPNVINYSTYSK